MLHGEHDSGLPSQYWLHFSVNGTNKRATHLNKPLRLSNSQWNCVTALLPALVNRHHHLRRHLIPVPGISEGAEVQTDIQIRSSLFVSYRFVCPSFTSRWRSFRLNFPSQFKMAWITCLNGSIPGPPRLQPLGKTCIGTETVSYSGNWLPLFFGF